MGNKRIRKLYMAVVCLLSVIFMNGMHAQAAEEKFSDGSAKREALSEIMNSNPEDAEEPQYEKPDKEAEYEKDFEYSEDIVLSGIFETNTYYFKVPDYWDTQYAYAQIEVELSQLIQDVPASLTFMVNDVPVTSFKMDYQNGKKQILYVEIPQEMLKEGYNTFDITGYVRIYDEEGCIDDFSGANWISISQNSYIRVGYELKDNEQKISAYPYPFMSSIDESGSSTYIAVSDKCTEEELKAALLLRADLGNETGQEDRISLVKESQLPSGEKKVILVSMLENLDETYRSVIEKETGENNLKEEAVVKLIEEDSSEMLLITSENKDCLEEAAVMLMDESRVSQEKDSIAFVKAGSAQLVKEASQSSDMVAGRYTLDALMDSGLSFIGPFHQKGDIYLPFSGGYVLADSGKIVLKFRYSKNLDFKRSMITVYWGDVPVASKKLTSDQADGDELSFTMPQDVVGTYAGKISIAFDLELPELFCTPRMDEMPWAYVTEESVFYLPVGAGRNYSLSQRPYPFEISSSFNHLLVVIPDEISDEELNTLGELIALYGEQLSPYGELDVKQAGNITEEDYDHNIITIGTYSDNSFLKALNENLYFSYSEKGDSFESNEQLVLSENYAKDLVTLQLLYSPYAEGRAVLAAASLSDSTTEALGRFLREDENVWKLEKDTVLIDSDLDIKTFEFAQMQKEVKQPILKTMLEENKDAAVFTIVATAIMLLLLLTLILILIRIYLRQKKS